jgi:hypothetical protein
MVLDDIFDDAVLRGAIEASLGMRARSWDGESAWWYFERLRLGLAWSVEASPMGLYAPLCRGGVQQKDIRSFIDKARRLPLVDVTINLNPLEVQAEALVEHAAAVGYQIVRRQTHLLPIGASIDEVRRQYHATKRYQALRRIDLRNDIVVANEPSQLRDYFALYAASLARWGRERPIHPSGLFERLLVSPAARFWMNYVDGRLACAMVVLYCRSYALYWQGVADIDARQKHAYPMVKLMDAVIEHLVDQRIPYLNLGASEGLPNVQRFKEEFGAAPWAYSSLTYRSAARGALQRLRHAVVTVAGGRATAEVHGDTRSGSDVQRRLG